MDALRRGVLTIGLLLVACTPSGPGAPTGGGVAPTAGPQLADEQKLVIGYSNLSPNLDPHFSSSGTFRKYEMFETLVLFSDDAKEVQPLLAASWQLSDPTTWRLKLRTDAKFHDGSALSADDVAYSWKRVNDANRVKSPVPGNMSGVAEIVAVDKSTVDVKTKAPDPLLLKKLPNLAIVPMVYLERVGDQEFTAKPVGSGPFRFKEFKADDFVTVTGWAEHPYRKPKLTEITIRSIPDSNARVNGLRTGDLHLIHQVAFDSANSLRTDKTEMYIREGNTTGFFMDSWGSNGTDAGPVGNSRVRQALCYAIDRQTLVKNIYGGLVPATGILVRETAVGFNADAKPYTYDVTRARQLLAQAGYPNGFKVTFDFWDLGGDIKSTVLFVQQQLKDVGVETELNGFDFATWSDKTFKRKQPAPLFLNSQGTVSLGDADLILRWFTSESGFGKRYSNPEFDAVYAQAAKEMDPPKREKLLQQAVKILQDDPPFCPLAPSTNVTAYQKTVGGIKQRPVDGDWMLFETLYRTK